MGPRNWQELLDLLCRKAKNDSNLKPNMTGYTADSGIEFINLCISSEFHRKMLLDWIESFFTQTSEYEKSASKSADFRIEGNKHFQSHNNDESLRLYTKSVCYAPETSSELPLALGNRSAVLFQKSLFQDSIRDINLSLKKNYPSHLCYKLYLRKAECLLALEQYNQAIGVLQLAKESLKNLKDETKKSQSSVERKLELCLARSLSRLNVGSCQEPLVCDKEPALPVPTYRENKKFVSASAALDLKYSESKGRHVVTNRLVNPGDILFVEKPYSCVVLEEHYSEHCHHCCRLFQAPIPCWGCTVALYCSDDCRQESWDQYHRWQCGPGLGLLHSVGIAHLGLRVALTAGPLHNLKRKVSQLKSMPVDTKFYGNEVDNYATVYNLLPHFEKMKGEDLFQYAVTAAMLVLYLKHHTDYFDANNGTEEDILFVGQVVLRHIAQLVCNGHAITKLHVSKLDGRIETEEQVRVGTAIYPSASMMNHSCEPNIINSFYNQYLIVRAMQHIEKGDEVFNCYGPNFRRMGTLDRKYILEHQYFFTCSCRHCSEECSHSFLDRFSGLRCSCCAGPLVCVSQTSPSSRICCDCGTSELCENLLSIDRKASSMFKKAQNALDNRDIPSAVNLLSECVDLRKVANYKHHKEITRSLDLLGMCYSQLGYFELSLQCVQECLPAVEEQYGINSIEVANELQKLSDVMICHLRELPQLSTSFRHLHSETVACIQRAKTIMELYYGYWNPGLQQIMDKEKLLQDMKIST